MSTQEDAQQYCLNILGYLYDERQKDPTTQLSITSLAEALNYDESSTALLVEDLKDYDLVASETGYQEVFITALGLDVIRRHRATRKEIDYSSRDVREEKTAASAAQIEVMLPETHNVVRVTFPAVADALRAAMADLSLNEQQRAELEADIHTVETQLASPRPKVQILLQCYRSMELLLKPLGDKPQVKELIRSVKSLQAR